MRQGRLLVLLVLVAAAAGFVAGWWYRDRSGDTIEDRTRQAAEHMKDAVRALTH